MPRACTICTHAERGAIDQALVSGTEIRETSALFRVSEDALTRHRAAHIPAALQTVARQQQEQGALDVMAELQRLFARINRLFDACDEWLTDPDDPARYSLDPRADEVKVIYSEPGPDGKPIRRRASLAVLLNQAAPGKAIIHVDTKHSDPRELVLKTAGQLQSQQEFLAKMLGQLQQEGTINILVAPEWLAIRATLLAALAPYPDARQAVAARLVALESSN